MTAGQLIDNVLLLCNETTTPLHLLPGDLATLVQRVYARCGPRTLGCRRRTAS